MQILLSSISLEHYGLNRVFAFAKEAGYDGVDIEVSKTYDTQDGAYIRSLSEQYGLPVVNLVTPKRLSDKAQVMKYVDLAVEIGAKIVTVHPPRLFDFSFTQWIKNELPHIRKKSAIKVALLNAVPSRLLGFIPQHAMNSPTELKRFREVALDTSNVYNLHEDLIRLYERLKGEIVHIFLSNVRGGRDHSLPMDGSMPIESLLTKLSKDGYKGALSLRVIGKELGEGNEQKVISKLKETKQFIEKYLKLGGGA